MAANENVSGLGGAEEQPTIEDGKDHLAAAEHEHDHDHDHHPNIDPDILDRERDAQESGERVPVRDTRHCPAHK